VSEISPIRVTAELPVEVEGRADQGEVRERLREVPSSSPVEAISSE